MAGWLIGIPSSWIVIILTNSICIVSPPKWLVWCSKTGEWRCQCRIPGPRPTHAIYLGNAKDEDRKRSSSSSSSTCIFHVISNLGKNHINHNLGNHQSRSIRRTVFQQRWNPSTVCLRRCSAWMTLDLKSPFSGVWTPLKNMKVSWDDDIPNIWKNKKMFQSTKQYNTYNPTYSQLVRGSYPWLQPQFQMGWWTSLRCVVN